MRLKNPKTGVLPKMRILIKAELTFRLEHKESWTFYEPKLGSIDMNAYEYPINQFSDFEILEIDFNKITMKHLGTIFILDFKTSRTFGEIIKRIVEDNKIAYGCTQITLSLQ